MSEVVGKEELLKFLKSIVDKALVIVQEHPPYSHEALYQWGKKDACVEIREWIEKQVEK